MKKYLIALSLPFSLITYQLSLADNVPVFRDQNGYVGINIGGLFPGGNYRKLLNVGYKLGAQIGYHYKNIRIEEELSYANTGIKNINGPNIDYFTSMTNLLLGVNVTSQFMLYAGAGAGYAYTWSDSSIKTSSSSKDLFNGFAYQGLAGVSFQYSRNWGVDLAYHYIRYASSSDMYAHVLDVRFNYLFG